MRGARRSGSGMYSNVHEDSEHRATTWPYGPRPVASLGLPRASPQAGTAVVLQQTHEDTRLRALRKQVQYPV